MFKKFIPVFISLVFCAFMFSGCDQVKDVFAPKFDASSVESFKESKRKIDQDLTADEQAELNKALLYKAGVYIKEHPGEALLNGGAALLMDEDLGETAIKFIKDDVNGKTAKQIINEYKEATK